MRADALEVKVLCVTIQGGDEEHPTSLAVRVLARSREGGMVFSGTGKLCNGPAFLNLGISQLDRDSHSAMYVCKDWIKAAGPIELEVRHRKEVLRRAMLGFEGAWSVAMEDCEHPKSFAVTEIGLIGSFQGSPLILSTHSDVVVEIDP